MSRSELVQLKLNTETSVGESTPTEAEYGVPLPLVDVGVSRLDEIGRRFIPATQWSSAILPILADGRNLKLPLSGLSMYPLLVGGRDEVLITTVLGKRLKRGDIVLYVQKDGTHVLHRIHHVKRNMYYMLGDAHSWIEGPIKEGDVLAVATAVIRKGKMIMCSQYSYKIISALWLLMRTQRPLILRIVKRLRAYL